MSPFDRWRLNLFERLQERLAAMSDRIRRKYRPAMTLPLDEPDQQQRFRNAEGQP